MTDPITNPSGDNDPNPNPSGEPNKDEKVEYSTYKKVLTEKKNQSERLRAAEAKIAEFETSQREKDENDLKETNQFKTLYENAKVELKESKDAFKGLSGKLTTAVKIEAFKETIDGDVASKYHGFIDSESIIIDPETGEVDQMSVKSVVEKFKADHSQLITLPTNKTSTNPYPKGESGSVDKISYDEWLKLPKEEMRKWKTSQIEG